MQVRNGEATVLIPRAELGPQVFVGLFRLKEGPALLAEDGRFYVLGKEGMNIWDPPGLARPFFWNLLPV